MLKLQQPITSINGFKIGDRVRLKDGDGRLHIIKSFSIDGIKEFFFEVQFEDGTDTMLDNIALLPSNLDEAAKISDLEAKNLADDYTKFLAAGLTKNEPRPIGPRWMKKLASDRFKAGAEWMAGQYEKIEGDPVDWYMTSEGKEYCFGIQSHDAIEVPVELYVIKKQ